MPASRERKHRSSIQSNKDFGKLPKYGPPVYPKPEKVDDMYPLKWTGFDNVSALIFSLLILTKWLEASIHFLNIKKYLYALFDLVL